LATVTIAAAIATITAMHMLSWRMIRLSASSSLLRVVLDSSDMGIPDALKEIRKKKLEEGTTKRRGRLGAESSSSCAAAK